MSENILYRVYIASEGEPGDGGVYVYEMDHHGRCTLIQSVHEVARCSLLTLNAEKTLLYAVGDKQIHAYAVSGEDGTLSYRNSRETGGLSACYVSVYPGDSYALVANYNSAEQLGSFGVFPLEADGGLKPQSDFQQLEGSSVNRNRQAESHPHMILPDPTHQVIFVPDLGIDKVMIYTLDQSAGKLIPHDPPYFELPAGAGPRHIAFHPMLPVMYIITELGNTVNAYQYKPGYSGFSHIQEISTLPAVADGETHKESYCSDIHISADGRYLYGANRGYNNIAIFKVDPNSGELSAAGHESTTGNWPRAFNLDPTGQWLMIANERSHDVPVFQINAESGGLTQVGEKLNITGPMWIEFVPV